MVETPRLAGGSAVATGILRLRMPARFARRRASLRMTGLGEYLSADFLGNSWEGHGGGHFGAEIFGAGQEEFFDFYFFQRLLAA